MNNSKLYVGIFFSLIFLIGAGILSVNVIVDAQGFYKVFSHEKLNQVKTTANSLGRFPNGANLYFHQFDTLLVGTSRVQSGMDPRMEALEGKRVYNTSIGDTDMLEIVAVLNYILEHQEEVTEIYFGLDFHPFSVNRPYHAEYEGSFFNPENNFYSVLLKDNFTKRSIGDSLRTLKANLKGRFDRYWVNGHYHSNAPIDYKANIENILNYYMGKKAMFGCFKYDDGKYDALVEVMKKFAEKGIQLNLFISPQHAKNLLMLEYTNLFDEYYNWMRDMTKMADELAQIAPGKVKLWNFSGFNFITNEKVSHDMTPMEYYYETSHYKVNVGEMMVRVMQDDKPIQDFGEPVTGENIEAIIANIQQGKIAYMERETEEVADLYRLYIGTQAERNSLNCQFN